MSTALLKKLTPAQRKSLLKELAGEEKKERQAKQKLFDGYKADVSKTVNTLFPALEGASQALAKVKQLVYDKTQELVNKKASLYEDSITNMSHTFTNEEGNISITIGYRIIDGWDDTITAGINKVKKYISNITSGDSDTKQLQFLKETVERLLTKDAQGNLKASRVLELKKVAEKIESKELQAGIAIIEKAFKPQRTKNFVTVNYKDAQGKQCTLPLNMTDVDIIIVK